VEEEAPMRTRTRHKCKANRIFHKIFERAAVHKKETSKTMVVAPSYKPDLIRLVGLNPEGGQAAAVDRDALHRILAVKLAAQGFDVPLENGDDSNILNLASDLFRVYREQSRLLESHLCPIDQRIQNFLDDVLKSTGETVQLPSKTVTVDRYGLARELSFPQNSDEFHNSEIDR
jgi:hypothetical protein